MTFAALIVCVRKGDGSLRVTIDFQMINKNVIDNAYPLHWIDDQINSMCGSAWFMTLRLDKGLSPDEFGYWFQRRYSFYNANGTVSVEGLAYGYEDFRGRLSTIDGFSPGGSSAKNCCCVY